ncbi:MAG TPA: bifunctional glutamine synthetase adenylyltransferase/deadenyltransferase, partial [Candidatus Competibacteraceae bacterium]|nr:bifunctional glutamine synthetase adenylyltransferase/deadenyltransferase [Candidatus Competibacteraceae bacterium]
MSAFASALAHLPAALQPEVSAYWHDYLAAAERAGLAPPENPDSLERIARVWAMSEFVARSCIREPALLAALLPGGELAAADASGVLAARCRPPLAEAPSEEALAGTLRRLRRREMVRIAWRDLAGEASLEETLEALSELADVLVDAALDWHYQRLCQRFGVPRDAEGRAQHLVVLGMGKLGGRELNYSSDIDLIFAYPDKGETDGARGLSNEEFFRRLGQAL